MTPLNVEMELPEPPLPFLKARREDSHKGSFGSALLVGGSRGMAGSIAMSGMAAAKAGAGLVRLAVPDKCLETVASYSPCLMTIPLPDDAEGRIATDYEALSPWVAKSNCLAIGPGLGQSLEIRRWMCELLAAASCPVVIDADGLNNLAAIQEWPKLITETVILTPHPGEWSRLSGIAAGDRDRQVAAAISIAQRHKMVIVLKGHHTLVTDGKTAVFNTSGTPAMATGGSGDVLTGIITALICQGLPPRDAAHLAVFVHGTAAEIAESEQGSHVVLPTELIHFLPRGFESRLRSSSLDIH
jgi:NAD(P)H-hydrate epimerase